MKREIKKRNSKYLVWALATVILCSSVIPKGVFGIKNLSPVQEAEAQLLGGGGGGMMQMLPQLLMMMMLFQFMQQNKGKEAKGKVKQARDDALQNLAEAGNKPSAGTGGVPNVPGSLNPGGPSIQIPTN